MNAANIMRVAAALAAMMTLQACAAALPVAAVALMGRERIMRDDDDAKVNPVDAAAVMARAAGVRRPPELITLGGRQVAPTPTIRSAAVAPVAMSAQPPEAAATAIGGPFVPTATASWQVVSDYLTSALGSARGAPGIGGVSCGDKPRALVVDIDEGIVRDDRWEAAIDSRIVAAPGAREAIEAARAAGLAVIYSSDRAAESAVYTEVALDFAGLGPARVGETLWLRGEEQTAAQRRAAIAERFCIVAMVGDGPGDFGTDESWPDEAAALLGTGWFVLPNPIQVEPDDTVTATAAPPAQETEE